MVKAVISRTIAAAMKNEKRDAFVEVVFFLIILFNKRVKINVPNKAPINSNIKTDIISSITTPFLVCLSLYLGGLTHKHCKS